MHGNRSDNQLQLQIDRFGEDILKVAVEWWSTLSSEEKSITNGDIMQIGSGPIGPTGGTIAF